MKQLIDISYYQEPEKINYDLLCENIDGVILRAAYGTGVDGRWPNQPDPAFNRHYTEFHSRGMPIGAYHYIVEYKPVDDQLGIFKQAVDGKELKLGFWNDVELENGAPALTRNTVTEYMTKAEAALGEFGIYTGAWCWNPIMGTDNPYSSRRLWVGSYTSSPYMPIGWDQWWMWQYTSGGKLPGYAGGLDMNRCTDAIWSIWVGNIAPQPIEPLDIKPMSQKDPKWAGDKLGTSSVTIGAYGCLITSVAMICNYYGKETDPGKINRDLISVNGYASGNLLRFAAVETIYPDIKVDWDSYLSNPTNAQINAVLKSGVPAIVQVDYKPDTPALDQHWVVVIGKDENGYLIADPIDGEKVYLSRYNDKAYRMVVYEQEEAEKVLFKAKVICGALNVRKGPSTNFDKVDLLMNGDVVNVYEVSPNNWFRIGEDKWCSGHPAYMEKIELEPPAPDPPTLESLQAEIDDIERRVTALEEAVF
jgi:GH25 family lysozyme M1 (1,4-beta-N-acetylmuramidase)